MVLNVRFIGNERSLHIYDYDCLSDKAINAMDELLYKLGIVRYKDIIVGEPDKIMEFFYEFTKRNEVYIE